jgi:GT2 family glycosyltransferase
MIVIEIKYSKTAKPSSIGLDKSDRRTLSVFFYKITYSYNENPRVVHWIHNNEYFIFGFYSLENRGRWSAGGKSCIIIPNIPSFQNKIRLTLYAHPFEKAFKSCKIFVKTSTGHQGSAVINKKNKFEIFLKKPIFKYNQRLLAGDFSKIYTANNVSLKYETPKISIIIANYKNHYLTYLASVAALSSNCLFPFEILCVDDGSSQKYIDDLKKTNIPINVLELKQNMGFAIANNSGAECARGEYLLFINNDVFLEKGAINEMAKAFEFKEDCFIVGSVLQFPDGIMQEAGATIQSDGYPIRHGRDDPKFKLRKLPRFQTVDYVSGACLMIRKSDFLAMGGFDEKYSPAYYEDTDLCMRSLLYRKKVYLASRANCYHIENATTSTMEDGSWATRTAEAHRQIFLKDWGKYLASRNDKDLPWHLKH